MNTPADLNYPLLECVKYASAKDHFFNILISARIQFSTSIQYLLQAQNMKRWPHIINFVANCNLKHTFE